MNPLVYVLIFFGAMFVVPWLLGRSTPPNDKRPETSLAKKNAPRKRRQKRIAFRQQQKSEEETYPRYNPNYIEDNKAIWNEDIEQRHRKHSGLPPDWERRRALVFIKADGKCRKCGRRCGHLACEANQIWGFHFDEHLLYDADVHHDKPRASGGDHNLNNLLLYCLRCHSLEHPENSTLRARRDLKGLGGGGSKKLFPLKAPKTTDEDVPF